MSDKKDKVYTNNCWGNVDYSPLAPTDTLNVSVSPGIISALTGSAVTTAFNPTAGAASLTAGLSAAMAGDLARGTPSFSVSITGHDGDTYGHITFP